MTSEEKTQQWWSLTTLFPWCYKERDHRTSFPENVVPMQVLEPMPPPQELDSLFAELVVRSGAQFLSEIWLQLQTLIPIFLFLLQNELGLSDQKKAAMFALPPEKKWEIYCFNKNVSDFIGKTGSETSPHHNAATTCLTAKGVDFRVGGRMQTWKLRERLNSTLELN